MGTGPKSIGFSRGSYRRSPGGTGEVVVGAGAPRVRKKRWGSDGVLEMVDRGSRAARFPESTWKRVGHPTWTLEKCCPPTPGVIKSLDLKEVYS